jgi:hypothetical protein
MNRTALRFGLVAAFGTAIATVPTAAHAQAKKAEAKAPIERKLAETQVKRDVFSGTEFRVAAMHTVNADCSSGPVPDVRVVTQPTHGDVRLEQVRTVIDFRAEERRVQCNGKEADARALFYKSRDGFTGQEKITVDVDYKTGTVKRFVYSIAVR